MEKRSDLSPKPAKDTLVHDFTETSDMKNTSKTSLIIFVVLLLFGVGTGYIFASMKNSTSGIVTSSGEKVASKDSVKKGQTFGVEDEKQFEMEEIPEGTLREGGIEGEGAFHLEREGGDARNVYLTSTEIDLSQFVGREVKIWGTTYEGEKAGWLMDVGRLQVLD